MKEILEALPDSILRIKGCTRLDTDEGYTFIEKIPNSEPTFRTYHGKLVSGPKLLVVGPGSDPVALKELVLEKVDNASF